MVFKPDVVFIFFDCILDELQIFLRVKSKIWGETSFADPR